MGYAGVRNDLVGLHKLNYLKISLSLMYFHNTDKRYETTFLIQVHKNKTLNKDRKWKV
jgi:hypothetical protein